MIDSHLHVWSDGEAPFPWDADNHPPAHLQAEATAEKLLGEMDHAMVRVYVCRRLVHPSVVGVPVCWWRGTAATGHGQGRGMVAWAFR